MASAGPIRRPVGDISCPAGPFLPASDWQQLAVLVVVACNPFIISNFVTSWDFNILFVPAMLGLVLLAQAPTSQRRLLLIGGLTLLTCAIKDEVSLVLAFWGITAWIFRIGDRRASMLIAGLSVFTSSRCKLA